MGLNKTKGDMYRWVTHTHTHLGGVCPHECNYCYVQAMARRFKSGKYAGELRLIEKELSVKYGSGKTVFVEHCNDLWAEGVPDEFVERVLRHCCVWPDNTYIFQTKNPKRFVRWLDEMPEKRLLGCTIETNDYRLTCGLSLAPSPFKRVREMRSLRICGERIFLTIEPIMRFDVSVLTAWIYAVEPEFVNIGADSKGSGLIEPSAAEVHRLFKELAWRGVEVRQKRNLDRLLQPRGDKNVARTEAIKR